MDLIKERNDKEFNGIYRGKVVSTDDPQKLGRSKIQVYPMLYHIESKYLPWATPAFSLFSGAGSDMGSFCIPSVGSFVFVFFEFGNLYQPVYFAEAQTAQKGIPTESQVNYPDRKVWKTRQGMTVYIDDSNNEMSINHPSGTKIVIDNTGKVLIDSDNIQLGDSLVSTDMSQLVKISDITKGQLISPSGPCTWLTPEIPGVDSTTYGTQKVKGV